jgi:hypothetical protein
VYFYATNVISDADAHNEHPATAQVCDICTTSSSSMFEPKFCTPHWKSSSGSSKNAHKAAENTAQQLEQHTNANETPCTTAHKAAFPGLGHPEPLSQKSSLCMLLCAEQKPPEQQQGTTRPKKIAKRHGTCMTVMSMKHRIQTLLYSFSAALNRWCTECI